MANLFKFWFSACLSVWLLLGLHGSASADELDEYRNILQTGSYMIVCKDVSQDARDTDKDVIQMDGSCRLYNLPKADKRVIIAASGSRRYTEIKIAESAVCTLSDGEVVYRFSRYGNPAAGRASYIGTGSMGTLKPELIKPGKDFVYGQDKGTYDISRMLNAILPPEMLPANAPQYRRVGAGTLENGRNYVDYRYDAPGYMEVIRYYFYKERLIKMASGVYTLSNDGEVLDGRRCVVKVSKFTDMVDMSYLSLPDVPRFDVGQTMMNSPLSRAVGNSVGRAMRGLF